MSKYDFHVHTSYSDGKHIQEMLVAAREVGLTGIGFTDHCVPYDDRYGRRDRFNFDETFYDRRKEIETFNQNNKNNPEIFDAVEINFDPNFTTKIEEFLNRADFDYAIGSVHYAGEYNISFPSQFKHMSKNEKLDAIEKYVDWQVECIDSGLFDILGHLDLPQRIEPLRNLMSESHYAKLACCLEGSEIIPEINAGRIDSEYGEFHPITEFLPLFEENEVSFILGTDSHTPSQLKTRNTMIDELFDNKDFSSLNLVNLYC